MLIDSKAYKEWLVECRDRRGWGWALIASHLVHRAVRLGMSRQKLLRQIKSDYQQLKMR